MIAEDVDKRNHREGTMGIREVDSEIGAEVRPSVGEGMCNEQMLVSQ